MLGSNSRFAALIEDTDGSNKTVFDAVLICTSVDEVSASRILTNDVLEVSIRSFCVVELALLIRLSRLVAREDVPPHPARNAVEAEDNKNARRDLNIIDLNPSQCIGVSRETPKISLTQYVTYSKFKKLKSISKSGNVLLYADQTRFVCGLLCVIRAIKSLEM
jgi:hypothetical protein